MERPAAARLANEDWRDLLMEAGFGEDPAAHEKWASALLGAKGGSPLGKEFPIRRKPMECRKSKNLQLCACTYSSCERQGLCCECIRYHLQSRELPGCCFPKDAEKSYDRSFEHFARLVAENRV